MIVTSTYEIISLFLLISILIFAAIAIIYLARISSGLKKLREETKEAHEMNHGITAEKLETNHSILSEININLRKLPSRKERKK